MKLLNKFVICCNVIYNTDEAISEMASSFCVIPVLFYFYV